MIPTSVVFPLSYILGLAGILVYIALDVRRRWPLVGLALYLVLQFAGWYGPLREILWPRGPMPWIAQSAPRPW